MIKVTINRNESVYTGFEFDGHAGFADHGNDLVCAAVSMLVFNTINSIEQFTTDVFDLSMDEKRGYIRLEFKNKISRDSILLLNSLILGLQGVEEEYGKEYIKLILKEV